LHRLRAGVVAASRTGEQHFEQLLLLGIHLIGLQDRKALAGSRRGGDGDEHEQRKDAGHGVSPEWRNFLTRDFEQGSRPCPGPRAARFKALFSAVWPVI
jgi:hypothetical protein